MCVFCYLLIHNVAALLKGWFTPDALRSCVIFRYDARCRAASQRNATHQ